MAKKPLFEPHSAEKQKEYERELRLEYGADTVNESIRRWNSYSEAEKQAIGLEGQAVYLDIVAAIEAHIDPKSSEVQAILDRWERHLHYFYEPSLEILRGLGDMYNTHPDFIANFQKIHVDLPVYLQKAIGHYVDELETALLEQMLAEDEVKRIGRLGG